jgi:hypothetical protein
MLTRPCPFIFARQITTRFRLGIRARVKVRVEVKVMT